jgi:fermentation-respiration switch protein FrsA (DUF1100 family)
MKKIAIILLIIPLLACLVVGRVFGQFYYPDKRVYQTPDQYGLSYESVEFQSRDKTKLHGWFVPATGTALGTVVFFHGNAQNLTAHFSFVKWLPNEGFNLFLFDYRSYGKSEGKPTREGVHQDALAALEYIQTRSDVDQDSLFVLAQSLGGAVAISAIGSTNIAGLCGVAVESTFDSYKEIAKEKAPNLLASVFISDALSPDAVVTNIAPTPMVFIHGTSDRVVPYRRGKRLWEQAKEPKALWTVNGGRHTEAFTTYASIYRPQLVAFFKKCLEQIKRRKQKNKGQSTRKKSTVNSDIICDKTSPVPSAAFFRRCRAREFACYLASAT